ncbi:MAG: hypothetical protein P4L63_02780 [Candidatus Pacebacteria bacterium]|nr:hypothetical protein [Candidatus Paceibacterota bacterium]
MNLKIKKITPYLLALIFLVGVFGLIPTRQAKAQTQNGWCVSPTNTVSADTFTDCNTIHGQWFTTQTMANAYATLQQQSTNLTNPGKDLNDFLANNSCGIGILGITTDNSKATIWPGCGLAIGNWLFITFPGLLLFCIAYFFNFVASITLYSNIYSGSTFLPTAWAVVRDLSNIFFILILLYIAVRLILGIGGHDTKQMIGKVIIIALLINFSMFFTEVVIDSSNILALIFYNKMSVTTLNADGSPRPYESVAGERDIAGGLVNAFNPMTLLSPTFFGDAGAIGVVGQPAPQPQPPSAGTVIGIMILAGTLMEIACYAFFVAGFSLISRMIELFILIIFSPFAFMSFTTPVLEHIEYIGWDAWLKRLLKTSFMAPIFMFFMYFIFLLVHSNMFGSLLTPNPSSIMVTLLSILIPELIVVILLLKATKFALDGSGKLGEMAIGAAKAVGGLALGAATSGASTVALGGAAAVSRATVGRAGAAISESGFAKKWEAKGWGGEAFRKITGAAGSASFDVRAAKIGGKTLASATGLNLGTAQKGGFTERRKEQIAKRQERAKSIEVGEDETLKQNLNKTETDLHDLLSENSEVMEKLDKAIEKKKEEVSVANNKLNAAKGTDGEGAAREELAQANRDYDFAKRSKKEFRSGADYMVTDSVGNTAIQKGTGISIEGLEEQKRDAARAIKMENIRRKHVYAHTVESGLTQTKDFIFSMGQHSFRGAREAAFKIRTDAKIEHGGGHGGGDSGHGGGGSGGGHTPAPKPAAASQAASHAPVAHAPTPDAHAAPAKDDHGGGGGHDAGGHGGGH